MNQSTKGPPTGKDRILRGGSWKDDAGGSRVATRLYGGPDAEGDHVGLRCARVTKSTVGDFCDGLQAVLKPRRTIVQLGEDRTHFTRFFRRNRGLPDQPLYV